MGWQIGHGGGDCWDIAGDRQQSPCTLVLQGPRKGPLEGVIVTEPVLHRDEKFEQALEFAAREPVRGRG